MPKGKMKETPEDQAVTKKALENSGGALLTVVEGIEDIEERMIELKAQRKAKLDAAKSDGYDPKAIKAVIKRRAETSEQAAARAELSATAELYLSAVNDAESL